MLPKVTSLQFHHWLIRRRCSPYPLALGCARRPVAVTQLLPPVPPLVKRHRAVSRFRATATQTRTHCCVVTSARCVSSYGCRLSGSVVHVTRNQVRVLACGLGIALTAMTLAGCDYAGRRALTTRPANTEPGSATKVPLPSLALLAPQPEPDCEFPATDAGADERQKLDYERQCYRHAEIIARARLRLLQRSVARTIRAIKQCDGCGLQSASLAALSD